MVKQLLLPLVAVMIFIAAVGYFYKNSDKVNQRLNPQKNTPAYNGKTVTIGDDVIKVEVARNDDQRKKGLSGRATLDAESGMIFVFEKTDVTPVFWMKDTMIPLDIVWINDGKVAKIDANVPVPKEGASDNELPRYSSSVPVDYVLEVNAGYTGARGISVGDSVDLSQIQ
jgi:uncharacterized membrane protein (UPF0127 family)